MPVLLIAEASLTEEVYAGIAGQMTPLIRAAKGFICHAGGPSPAGGWCVVEIWESEEDGQNWLDHSLQVCGRELATAAAPARPHTAPV